MRTALRSGEPLNFMAVVSGLLEVTDPRNRDPFALDEQGPGIDDLVESFVGTPYAETTAALTVIQALTADDLLAVISGGRWRQPDPDVWFLTHVLGDGDDYLFGVVLPTGDALSTLVYVDHNMGSVVKDAFVVPVYAARG